MNIPVCFFWHYSQVVRINTNRIITYMVNQAAWRYNAVIELPSTTVRVFVNRLSFRRYIELTITLW